MSEFAAWTNLAETTFILPPTDPNLADYRLKIFTPQREMLFAGHPTLGSCAAWLHAGHEPAGKNLVRQECGVGIVDIVLDGAAPAFVAPPTQIQAMNATTKSTLAEKLGLSSNAIIDCAQLNNGPVWQVFELATANDVLNVNAGSVGWPSEKAIGLIGPHRDEHECDFEVRMLAPSSGMSEDPITGSLNSALAHWFSSRGTLPNSMVVAQGTKIGRTGRVYISRDSDDASRVYVGGHTSIIVEGTVVL